MSVTCIGRFEMADETSDAWTWAIIMASVEGKRLRGLNMIAALDGGNIILRAVDDALLTEPNGDLLAVFLSRFAERNESLPPVITRWLANMFAGEGSVSAGLKWKKGGKPPTYDRAAIAKFADDKLQNAPRGHNARIIFEVSEFFSCSQRIVKEALRDFRAAGHAQGDD